MHAIRTRFWFLVMAVVVMAGLAAASLARPLPTAAALRISALQMSGAPVGALCGGVAGHDGACPVCLAGAAMGSARAPFPAAVACAHTTDRPVPPAQAVMAIAVLLHPESRAPPAA